MLDSFSPHRKYSGGDSISESGESDSIPESGEGDSIPESGEGDSSGDGGSDLEPGSILTFTSVPLV